MRATRHQWRRSSTQTSGASAGTMSITNKLILSGNLRTQAGLRARLGMPVCVGMLLCLWYWGPATPDIGASQILAAVVLNVAYNAGVLLAVRPESRLKPVLIARFTAVMDPLLLSLGLALLGEAGQLFA